MSYVRLSLKRWRDLQDATLLTRSGAGRYPKKKQTYIYVLKKKKYTPAVRSKISSKLIYVQASCV